VLPTAETALHAALMASRVCLTLHGHLDILTRVDFSPDGTVPATASWDGTTLSARRAGFRRTRDGDVPCT